MTESWPNIRIRVYYYYGFLYSDSCFLLATIQFLVQIYNY